MYRLLKEEDVQPALLAQEVYVLWPDDGVWYAAVVEKVREGSSFAWELALNVTRMHVHAS